MRITVAGMGKLGSPWLFSTRRWVTRYSAQTSIPGPWAWSNAGEEPFPGEAHLSERLKEVLGAGRLSATTDATEAVSSSAAVVLVVPLFVDDCGPPRWRCSGLRTVVG